MPGPSRARRRAVRIGPLVDAAQIRGLRVERPAAPGLSPSVRSCRPRAGATADGVQAVFDALAAVGEPVVVIRFSTGGTLACDLATTRPVARLVLLAPVPW